MSLRGASDLTHFEHSKITEIIDFEQNADVARELLICIDSAGNGELARAEGEPDHVVIPPNMEQFREFGGSLRLFHNHPKRHSISDTDWQQSVRWEGRADVVAVNVIGDVFCGRASLLEDLSIVAKRDKFLNAWKHLEELVYKGCAWKPFYDHMFSHVINLELRSRHLIQYDAHLGSVSKTAMDLVDHAGLMPKMRDAVQQHLF